MAKNGLSVSTYGKLQLQRSSLPFKYGTRMTDVISISSIVLGSGFSHINFKRGIISKIQHYQKKTLSYFCDSRIWGQLCLAVVMCSFCQTRGLFADRIQAYPSTLWWVGQCVRKVIFWPPSPLKTGMDFTKL